MYFHGEPLYPFGHGLSYTNFTYTNLRINRHRLSPGRVVELTVDVANTGNIAGDEVAQLYVRAPGKVERPNLQLAAFQRVPLRPGETQTVTFSLPHDHIALRYWDEAQSAFTYDAGSVEVMIGASSADIRLRGHIALA